MHISQYSIYKNGDKPNDRILYMGSTFATIKGYSKASSGDYEALSSNKSTEPSDII